jgi:hypothetical protein
MNKLTLKQRAKVRARDMIHRAVFRLSMLYSPDFPAETSAQIQVALGALGVLTPGPGRVVVYLPTWQRWSLPHRVAAARYLDKQLEMGRAWEIKFGRPPAPVFDLGAARRRKCK